MFDNNNPDRRIYEPLPYEPDISNVDRAVIVVCALGLFIGCAVIGNGIISASKVIFAFIEKVIL